MDRKIILFFIMALYYGISTYALYSFDAGLLVTSLVLFGVPALTLSHFTLAPAAVIVSVTLLGAGVAVLLEGTAHIYGLWYSLGISEARLFGLVPVEMLMATTVQIVFLALLYEVFFDDGVYTPRSAWHRLIFFGVFAVSIVVLLAIHKYVLEGLFVSYSYLWIIGSIVLASLAAFSLHRDISVSFLDRIIDFTLVASIPLGLSLWISSVNVHKVFGNTSEYLYSITFYGQTVPLEEIVLLFAIPFFVATIYEIYLDDQV